MRKLRILLIGEGAAGVQTLRRLSASPHTVVGVMTSLKKPAGLATSLANVACAAGHKLWAAELVKDAGFAATLRSEGVDLILNVHSLYLIKKSILEAPTIGSFNLHPGPLPKYAGLNSVCWSLYNGETVHGVTIHHMVPEIDAGPIALQTLFPVGPSETGFELSAKCTNEGVRLLEQLLECASHGLDAIPCMQQDLSRRTYFGRGVPNSGMLSWFSPARNIVNFVRACDFYPFSSPWGVPKTSIAGREVGIGSAQRTGVPSSVAPGTLRRSSRGIEAAAQDEWLLIRRVLQEGKWMSPAEILQPGERLESIADLAPTTTTESEL